MCNMIDLKKEDTPSVTGGEMKHLNKLVRDRVPEILDALGEKYLTMTLPEEEYREELDRKLQEEVLEYLRGHTAEELADVLEVLYAIAETHGISKESLENIRLDKLEKAGGFNKRILLKTVWRDGE